MTAEKPLTERLADAATKRDGTTYIVLRTTGNDTWKHVATTTAASAIAAIRQVVSRLDEAQQNGEYVAAPTRSFQAVNVTVERQTRLHIEEA